MNVETRAVLGAAYLPSDERVGLTHAVDAETDRPLCKRVKADNLADPYAQDPDLPPTCPVCLKRDPRFGGRR